MQPQVTARILIAAVAGSLAFLCLSYADFSPLGQALPTALPGRSWLLQGSGWLLLLATLACLARSITAAALIVGVYEISWALASTPPFLANPLSIGPWYGFMEALSALVCPVLAGFICCVPTGAANPPRGAARVLTAASIVFGLTCIFYGASHFAYADYTASMVPAWLPAHLSLARLTGAAHVAAGIALVVGFRRRLAATLEALMMSLFGLLVWVPSFFMTPRPQWATPDGNRWSELVITVVVAISGWMLALAAGSPSRPRHRTGSRHPRPADQDDDTGAARPLRHDSAV